MDESGFAIDNIEASERITNATVRQKFQAKRGHQEWVTTVERVSADGSFIPLFSFLRAGIYYVNGCLLTFMIVGNLDVDG